MVIGAKEHQYCSGSQHTQTQADTAPPLVYVCATGVFFWASEAGAERWPIDKEAMDAFHSTFRSASRPGAPRAAGGGAAAATDGSSDGRPRDSAGGASCGGYGNKRKVDRVRQRKDRQRQKARRKKRTQQAG
eukprot:COSAG02_NODE_17801_length_980_cov_1.087401_1_plen_131_part_01